jgi:hypothetical protein
MDKTIPSLDEWIRGAETLKQQVDRFYQKVPADRPWLPSSLTCHPNIFNTWHSLLPYRAALPTTPLITADMLR